MNKTPKWLNVSFICGLLGAFGGLIAAAVYSQFLMPPKEHQEFTAFGARLVYFAIVSLGWAFVTVIIHTARVGSYYSGFRRGNVNRTKDPIHFWFLLGIFFLLVVALIGFGVFKFVNP